MSPRQVIRYRVLRGRLVADLSCGHSPSVSAHPKRDLRTLPRTVPSCAECEKNEPPPKSAA